MSSEEVEKRVSEFQQQAPLLDSLQEELMSAQASWRTFKTLLWTIVLLISWDTFKLIVLGYVLS